MFKPAILFVCVDADASDKKSKIIYLARKDARKDGYSYSVLIKTDKFASVLFESRELLKKHFGNLNCPQTQKGGFGCLPSKHCVHKLELVALPSQLAEILNEDTIDLNTLNVLDADTIGLIYDKYIHKDVYRTPENIIKYMSKNKFCGGFCRV